MNQPNPGYSFVLCSADDPKRSDFYCHEYKEWHISIGGKHCGCKPSQLVWRKPIELPAVLKDEWEIVPETELDTTPDDQAWMFLDGKRFRPLYNGWIRKTAREWRNHKCDSLNTPAFIRRKSQPVSAVESGAEQVATDLSATHRLKCWPKFFQAIVDGKKTFEARKNDRDYREGDTLLLLEWNPDNGQYTGRSQRVYVPHILYGPEFGMSKDHCVMSITLLAGYAKGAAK